MSDEVRPLAEQYLTLNKVSYSRILRIVYVDERHSHIWKSLFKEEGSGRGGLWQVDIERKTLPVDMIDSGNVFCLFIDLKTQECAPFYPF